MIKNIFLPDAINNYYIFPKRIASCDISQSHVRVALAVLQGYKRTVERVVQQIIENSSALPYEERVASAIKKAVNNIGKYDELHIILPSSAAVYKELTTPFANINKIKLVLPFEVEPLLPFAVHEATFDCIVTEHDTTSSSVFVGAVKNETVAEYLSFFAAAQIAVDCIKLDIFELYALYTTLVTEKKNDVLVYSGLHSSRIAIIAHGQLKSVRYIPHGVAKLAKLLGTDADKLVHLGIDIRPDTVEQTSPFFSELQLTIAAAQKIIGGKKFDRILLMGAAADIKNVDTLFQTTLDIKTENFGIAAIRQKNRENIKINNGIDNNAIIAIAGSLLLPLTEDFNLYKSHVETQETKRTTQQLIAALILFLLIVILLFVNLWLNKRRFNNEINKSEKETIALLKKELPALARRAGSLETIKNAARSEITREKAIWFALSPRNRFSFLNYLQELSTRLDAEGLGLILTRLTLNEDSMTLEGQVKSYEALTRFEEDLRQSKLFASVPRLEELKFSVKLPLNKTYGES